VAAAEPRPEAPPASKRRKTVVPASTQPPTITHDDVILRTLQGMVPERRNAEPDVLVRASYLKNRFTGLIAKAAETLSIRHQQNLERRPTVDIDQGSRGAEAEGERALRERLFAAWNKC
jgi:hypothetical protein